MAIICFEIRVNMFEVSQEFAFFITIMLCTTNNTKDPNCGEFQNKLKNYTLKTNFFYQ